MTKLAPLNLGPLVSGKPLQICPARNQHLEQAFDGALLPDGTLSGCEAGYWLALACGEEYSGGSTVSQTNLKTSAHTSAWVPQPVQGPWTCTWDCQASRRRDSLLGSLFSRRTPFEPVFLGLTPAPPIKNRSFLGCNVPLAK
ncbi:hypothetical protein PGQ11_011120 [Apiospora arundinis]|uniref:Uncharacterized protein n=1 Tax=Apiospora arundinis TaxID=335852 RepID=A0ABR2HYM2_9PEZI